MHRPEWKTCACTCQYNLRAEKIASATEVTLTFDRCDHVRNQACLQASSIVQPSHDNSLMRFVWRRVKVRNRFALTPSKCRLALILTQEIRALCADSLGKLKSLYAYPMGIHII